MDLMLGFFLRTVCGGYNKSVIQAKCASATEHYAAEAIYLSTYIPTDNHMRKYGQPGTWIKCVIEHWVKFERLKKLPSV